MLTNETLIKYVASRVCFVYAAVVREGLYFRFVFVYFGIKVDEHSPVPASFFPN